MKSSADWLKDCENAAEVLQDRLEFFQGMGAEFQKEIDAFTLVLLDLKHWTDDQRDSIAHSEVTVEMESGKDIPLAVWARREGLDESYVRQKARRGSLKTAHKVGRDWFINEMEMNFDNRRKK